MKTLKIRFLLISFVSFSLSAIAQDYEVVIPENAIPVYGTLSFEGMYDGEFYYEVEIQDGPLKSVSILWRKAGFDDEKDVFCDCSVVEGEKFIGFVIESSITRFDYETGEETETRGYRPIVLRSIN